MTSSVGVTFIGPNAQSRGRTARATLGETVLQAAQAAGVDIAATCGGRGRCRSCRVKVLKGDVPPPTVQDTIQLGHDEVHEQFRLSCQTRVVSDCTVLVAPPKTEVGHQILASGRALDRAGVGLDSGVEKRVIVAKAPADEHHQTSDVEEILAALTPAVSREIPLEIMRKLPGMLRAQKGLLTVTRFNQTIIDVEAGDTSAHKYGMASQS